jgi:hypothetical protein
MYIYIYIYMKYNVERKHTCVMKQKQRRGQEDGELEVNFKGKRE